MRFFIFTLSTLITVGTWGQTQSWPLSVHQRLSDMTMEQKVGQLLFYGFPGTTLSPRLKSLLQRYEPGGLIVFSHNIQSAWQVAHLLHGAQKLSSTPLWVGVDQEGGDVSRIKTYPPFPSALALGRTESEELALMAGQESGRLLKSLGFNMNLAPVVDIVSQGHSSFLRTRSFGHDARAVSKLTLAYSQGLLQAGVLPTLKHFPGHGAAASDSHKEQPVIHAERSDLFGRDLLPFGYLLKNLNLPPAIMVAHVSYPNLDGSLTAATYSAPIVQGLLRRNLGFEGLTLTDDLEMSGADSGLDVSERAVRAFLAGNDLLMVVWTPEVKDQVFKGILQAVRSGRISNNRLDESVLRILTAKTKMGLFQELAPPNKEKIQAMLSSPRLKTLSQAVVLSSLKKSIPADVLSEIQNGNGPILIVSARKSIYAGLKELSRGRTLLQKSFSEWSAGDLNRWLKENPTGWAIVHVGGKHSGQWLSAVKAGERNRIVVVNTGAVRDLRDTNGYPAVVALHSHQPELGELLGKLLFTPLRTPATPP